MNADDYNRQAVRVTAMVRAAVQPDTETLALLISQTPDPLALLSAFPAIVASWLAAGGGTQAELTAQLDELLDGYNGRLP